MPEVDVDEIHINETENKFVGWAMPEVDPVTYNQEKDFYEQEISVKAIPAWK